MQDANCDQKFWAEAVNTAVYLKNRSPHKAVRGKTPEEIWTGRMIDLSHLKVFGCLAYVHVPKNLKNKWDVEGKPYLFVGYCEDTKGYRLFDLEEKGKIIRARDVVFLENEFSINDTEETNRSITHIKLSNEEGSENSPEDDSTQSNEIRDDLEEEEVEEYKSLTETEEEVADKPLTVLETEKEDRRYPIKNRNSKEYPDYMLYQTTCEPNDQKLLKKP
ncbi:retrovirus-related pol polyprotein from transposon tnt 1-94 [Lasius niger]|uniref:Retrovirus-related pol polyprotein from transposon tnt 1-94 n=1 Tax=Lasius niger TaxID=67767 RepID=A0A0J7MNL2_LASNI|nr:retrovirus-related pol polyprotein from transposon tnt 1-94 [Lasius niger]